MATELCLVRHGHTKDNRPFLLAGRLDNPLDTTGIAEAQSCRTKIRQRSFDVVYCSPARRTTQTARIVVPDLALNIIYDERLLERAYGHDEGKWSPLAMLRLWNYEKSYTKSRHGEETILGLELRVHDFLEEIRQKHPEQRILAVTHSGVITTVDTILNDRPRTGHFFQHFHADNCEIASFYL